KMSFLTKLAKFALLGLRKNNSQISLIYRFTHFTITLQPFSFLLSYYLTRPNSAPPRHERYQKSQLNTMNEMLLKFCCSIYLKGINFYAAVWHENKIGGGNKTLKKQLWSSQM